MLSYLEGVTNAEIAGIVDRSVARVRQELDRGLATIGGDPSRAGRVGHRKLASAYSCRSVPSLPAARRDAGAPATPDRLGRSRCRNARSCLLTVSAVHRPYVEPRQPGVWTFSHTVRSLPGWSVRSRTVEREWRQPPCAPSRRKAADAPLRSAPRAPPGSTAAASPSQGSGWRSLGLLRRARLAKRWRRDAVVGVRRRRMVIIECGNLTAPRKVLPKLGSRVALAVEPILLLPTAFDQSPGTIRSPRSARDW